MKMMEVDPLDVVSVNYESPDLPKSVRDFRPVIFHDGSAFCCLLGPDPQIGVFGCGPTMKEAVADWDKDYQAHLKNVDNDDEVTCFLLDTNANSKKTFGSLR